MKADASWAAFLFLGLLTSGTSSIAAGQHPLGVHASSFLRPGPGVGPVGNGSFESNSLYVANGTSPVKAGQSSGGGRLPKSDYSAYPPGRPEGGSMVASAHYRAEGRRKTHLRNGSGVAGPGLRNVGHNVGLPDNGHHRGPHHEHRRYIGDAHDNMRHADAGNIEPESRPRGRSSDRGLRLEPRFHANGRNGEMDKPGGNHVIADQSHSPNRKARLVNAPALTPAVLTSAALNPAALVNESIATCGSEGSQTQSAGIGELHTQDTQNSSLA